MLQNIEAEKAVIGSLIIDPTLVENTLGLLSEDTFFLQRHKIIFRAMKRIKKDGRGVDPITVSDEIERMGLDKDRTSLSYLRELIGSVVNVIFVDDHLRTILDCEQKRALETTFRQSLAALDDGNLADLIDKTEKSLSDVKQAGNIASPVMSMTEATDKTLEYLKNPEPMIPTGFSDLDEHLRFRLGYNMVIGADTSAGKSALGVQIIMNMAKAGYKCMICSLEMSTEDIHARILSAATGLSSHELRHFDKSQSKFDSIMSAAQKINKLPISYLERTKKTRIDVDSAIRFAKEQHERNGLDVFLGDYLQLFKPTESDPNASMHTQMIEVLEKFRNFAHYEKIAVILLSQLPRSATTTRGKNNPKPTLHDLKESGNIENDAENVLMMWQPIRYNIKKVEIDGQDYATYNDFGDLKLAEIIVAKQRHGKSGWSVPLWFDGNITSFYGYENREAE